MPNRLSATTTKAGYSQFGSTLYGFLTRPRSTAEGRATGSESATSRLSNYFSDEERDRALRFRQRHGRPGRLVEAFDEVLSLEAEQVHRHLTGDQADAHFLGYRQQLVRACHVMLLGEVHHHRGPGAGEIHLRQLQMLVTTAVHHRKHPLHPVLARDSDVVLDQREQPPEGEEHGGLLPHR